MNDWNGEERRVNSAELQLREIIRDELRPVRHQQEQLRKEQAEITTKIMEWELGAKWFRIFIIGTVGLISMGAAAWEWARGHIR